MAREDDGYKWLTNALDYSEFAGFLRKVNCWCGATLEWSLIAVVWHIVQTISAIVRKNPALCDLEQKV